MRVVSLFDGMGCLQIALNVLGVEPEIYFASEVEPMPMKISKALFPNTVYIGDVRNVKGSDLGFIDLLGGGSPCQSFSFAGKRKGMAATAPFAPPTEKEYNIYLKKLDPEIDLILDFDDYIENQRMLHDAKYKELIEILTLDHYMQLKQEGFEFEGQSYLFWEYVRILKELREINPDIKFLLENVVMGKKWQKVLSDAIGINPVKINSALLSAQNRNRLYWSNINIVADGFFDFKFWIPQPKDKGILLKDILEKDVADKYFLSEKMLNYLNTRKANYNAGKINFKTENDTASYINASVGLDISDNIIVVHNTMPRSSKTGKGGTGPLSRSDGKTYCLDTGNTNAVEINCGTLRTHKEGQGFRQVVSGKVATVPARAREDGSGQNVVFINNSIRRLTPRECGRLQTIPEPMLDVILNCGVKDTHIYKAFGNGWTIDVIVYILSFIIKNRTEK